MANRTIVGSQGAALEAENGEFTAAQGLDPWGRGSEFSWKVHPRPPTAVCHGALPLHSAYLTLPFEHLTDTLSQSSLCSLKDVLLPKPPWPS